MIGQNIKASGDFIKNQGNYILWNFHHIVSPCQFQGCALGRGSRNGRCPRCSFLQWFQQITMLWSKPSHQVFTACSRWGSAEAFFSLTLTPSPVLWRLSMLGRLRLGLPIRKCSSECIRVVFLVTITFFRGDAESARYGAKSVAVPGEAAGYWEAKQKYGQWSCLICLMDGQRWWQYVMGVHGSLYMRW